MRKFLRRMDALFHRGRLQQELDEEMAAHREMMPADRQPHFGSALRLSEQAADEWGFAWFDQLRQDLSYGVRSFRRSPGFALTAVAVLSLGIGVNLAEETTAGFSSASHISLQRQQVQIPNVLEIPSMLVARGASNANAVAAIHASWGLIARPPARASGRILAQTVQRLSSG